MQQNCSLHFHGTEIFGNDLLTDIGDISCYLGSRPVSTVFTHCLTWIYSSLTLLWQITGFSSEFSFSLISSLPSLPRSKCSSFFCGLVSICYRSVFQLVLSHLSICLKNEDSLGLFWWCFLITWWWWWLLPVHLCKSFFVIVCILMIDFLYFWGLCEIASLSVEVNWTTVPPKSTCQVIIIECG